MKSAIPACVLFLAVFSLPARGQTGCSPTPVVDSIVLADPTQVGRLFRDAVPDTCVAPGTCGAPIAGSYHYKSYTYHNFAGSTSCVQVDVTTACTGTNFIYVGAYSPTFDSVNICTNFAASIGSSPTPSATMSFDVPAGADFVVVVTEVTANGGCPSFSLTVTGCPTPVELIRFDGQ